MQGVFGLGLGICALLLVAAMALIFAVLSGGPAAAAVVVGVTGVLLAPTFRRPGTGRSLYTTMGRRVVAWWNKRTGRSVLVQGPAGMTPDGRARMPGLLAQSELISAQDVYGQPFGIIRVPATGSYSIVIETSGSGTDLTDQETVDRQVARWGAWLASLGQNYPDVIGAQASIETAPDTGVRLRRAIDQAESPDAQPFAREVMGEIRDSYPAGQSEIGTRISVTFKSTVPGRKQRVSPEDMATRIGNVLPSILSGLLGTGASAVARPMTAQNITDYVRVAWDPLVATLVQEARQTGEGTGMVWEDAGPTFLDDRDPKVLRHDRAFSISWQMLEAPRSPVPSDTLKILLAPHPEITRKRVTLLYRPLSIEQSVNAAEAEVTNAEFVVNNSKKVTSRDMNRMARARATAREEADGASLLRFGVIVTATVTSADTLPRVVETVQNLTSGAKLKMRAADWTQASTFTAGLPLGLVLPAQVLVPPEIGEAF
ncbi:hypothetical protein GGQ54_003345 [Naumannella cuiyingiana]|uniref:Integral membrane protein n=2 Tax=Naumannella cuiyingiana TaxID=1347891 RepID=A0A7Z0DC01_9ACTN|nr:SCO6880 family protein [Naumannella cuiyingiana]NYI72731.1 hypothetical protein [Naumannella cuiyingiana]